MDFVIATLHEAAVLSGRSASHYGCPKQDTEAAGRIRSILPFLIPTSFPGACTG